MGLVRVDLTGHSRASPQTVYDVAANSSRYPEWSRIGAFEAVRPGADGPFGVGSRRIFRTWPLRLLEEVVELRPGRLVAYTVLKGLPFRGYRADIELEPDPDGGTRIRWRCAFEPTILGTGGLCRAFMTGVFSDMLPALAAEAERIEAAP